MATYGRSTSLEINYAEAVERTRAALMEQGFGVLSVIDVAATLQSKLGIDMPPQVILGACNPPLAHRALTIDPSIGVLLPCNVVVRAVEQDRTIVEALDPQVMVQLSQNPQLAEVADEAASRLAAALDSLSAARESA